MHALGMFPQEMLHTLRALEHAEMDGDAATVPQAGRHAGACEPSGSNRGGSAGSASYASCLRSGDALTQGGNALELFAHILGCLPQQLNDGLSAGM